MLWSACAALARRVDSVPGLSCQPSADSAADFTYSDATIGAISAQLSYWQLQVQPDARCGEGVVQETE